MLSFKDEIRMASVLVSKCHERFCKTSTGFGSGGAEIKGVQIIKETIKNKAAIKSQRGIRDFETTKIYPFRCYENHSATASSINGTKKETEQIY